MNPIWILRTGRLVLTPVGGADLPDLRRIKSDPQVFAVMLGGVRGAADTADELAHDVIAWGANGFGVGFINPSALPEGVQDSEAAQQLQCAQCVT